MSNRRRSIDMSADLSRAIALAAAFLGLPSGEAFIQLAISNELADVAAHDSALRRILYHL